MPTRSEPACARWSSLGTYTFLTTGDAALLAPAMSIARGVLAEVDRACSRFRDDSDLTRANARPGSWVGVGPLLVAAVQVAVEAAAETDGLVDPCLGRTIISLGYDADMATVQARKPGPWRTSSPPPRPDAWREVEVDENGRVKVPAGCALDLGATGKAWASDLVARTIADELGCDLVVSLGGDVRLDGPDEAAPRTWPVSVTEIPGDRNHEELVWVTGGGLATSSTTSRRWRHGAQEHHHLIDPRTGSPTTGVWRTVTATGPTCVAANTATTAALVLGQRAVPWLEERGVCARLVARDGSVARVGKWPDPVPGDGPEQPTRGRGS